MRPSDHAIGEARAHLGAALSQMLPTDDQIIMEHVRAAYRELGGEPMDHHAQREFLTATRDTIDANDDARR